MTVSEAAAELAGIAAAETQEGSARKQEWPDILQGELGRARKVQESAVLGFREIEQAVFAIFLHSQPAGQTVRTPDLMTLLGHTRPDKIMLEQALLDWTDYSWFLDENAFRRNDKGEKLLPQSWRLGLEPNLQQMFYETRQRVPQQLIEERLKREISACESLIAGARFPGVLVYRLPRRVEDIRDDPQFFHYVILGPDAASVEGQPSEEARRFIETKTASGALRVYRNAILLAVPSTLGIQEARNAISAHEGWLEVDRHLREQLQGRKLEPNRRLLLDIRIEETAKNVPRAVQRAYRIVVTVSSENEVEAFQLITDSERSLFKAIKSDSRARIREESVDAAALLPTGPYNIWHEEEGALEVSKLLDAFPHFARLPKIPNRRDILKTLLEGCQQGIFVLRSTRGDGSQHTYWREELEPSIAQALELEVLQTVQATLANLNPHLLERGVLPQLWQGSELALRDVYRYFSGQVLQIYHEEQNFTELVEIPRCSREVIDRAVLEVVKMQDLWIVAGRAGFMGEEVPLDLLSEEATLQSALPRYVVEDILPQKLPEAWGERGQTTALAIADALAINEGKPLPWLVVRKLIGVAFQGKLMELTEDSGPWPCDAGGAQEVKLRLRLDEKRVPPSTPSKPVPSQELAESRPPYIPPPPVQPMLVAEAGLSLVQLQNLGDQLPDLATACAEWLGTLPKFHLRLELDLKSELTAEQVEELNRILEIASDELKLR